MFKKSIISASLILAGCNVLADDISKLTHLDCRYDHSKTEVTIKEDRIGKVSDADLAEALEWSKKNEIGYHVIISDLWTRVSHTFYWLHTWDFNSDEWKKLSKREKASWKMRFDGKIAYYDSDEVILEKFSPHPMKLEYGSFNERVYWSRMSNMISRKDGSFYIVLSSSDYTATLEGTCSVIEDSDRLF
jgi:YHS domain-containing protein